MTKDTIKAGIVGATGYTGMALISLLLEHPRTALECVTSRTDSGKPIASVLPHFLGTDLVFETMDLERLSALDVVFFATPHGVAMQNAPYLIDKGVRVIDLGADFRLQNVDAFLMHYHITHNAKTHLKDAVYGLPELNRARICGARLIANPGCYPTTVLLGLLPILHTQNHADQALIDPRIIADAKSGITGAGRSANLALNFAENAENLKAYGVFGHRHLPEMQEIIARDIKSRFPVKLRFVPHLVPMMQGMLTTLHLELTCAGQDYNWHEVLDAFYKKERFVHVLPEGELPQTRQTRHTNHLAIGVAQLGDVLTLVIAQDNLGKGAASQAVQNMNLLFGFKEDTGLMYFGR